MESLLFIQENEFFVTKSIHPLKMQLLYTQANKLVTSDGQICFPAAYLNLHAEHSHMQKMPGGQTSPALPYTTT